MTEIRKPEQVNADNSCRPILQGTKQLFQEQAGMKLRNSAFNPEGVQMDTLISEDRSYQTGLEYMRNSDFLSAGVEFRNMLEMNPLNPDAWFQLGHALFGLGQLIPSATSFQRALAYKPGWFEAYVSIAVVYESLGFYHEALLAYKNALKTNPSDLRIRQSLVNILEKLRMYDEAASICAVIVKYRPTEYLEKKLAQMQLLASEKLQRFGRPDDHNAFHAGRADSCCNVNGKTCLVIGCNTGKDCTYFTEFGAAAVDGVDVIDDIGKDFARPNVRYFKISAENMDCIESNSYDLVYSFATMEHVPRIDLAFNEMVRVTKPGGMIYSIAAPLWNSQFGHHKRNVFPDYPWIHLRLNALEILDYGKSISAGKDIESHIRYMLSPKFFNMTPAQMYVDVCSRLPGIMIVNNDLTCDDESLLTTEIYAELMPKGYSRQELLARVHLLVARKLPLTTTQGR